MQNHMERKRRRPFRAVLRIRKDRTAAYSRTAPPEAGFFLRLGGGARKGCSMENTEKSTSKEVESFISLLSDAGEKALAEQAQEKAAECKGLSVEAATERIRIAVQDCFRKSDMYLPRYLKRVLTVMQADMDARMDARIEAHDASEERDRLIGEICNSLSQCDSDFLEALQQQLGNVVDPYTLSVSEVAAMLEPRK